MRIGVSYQLLTILAYNPTWLVASNMAGLFSISYLGCHPKPIDFHSIIFQDG